VGRVVTFRNFTVAVGLCLTASICLALVPLVDPQMPIFPFIAANWVIWMTVGLVFRRSKAEWITYAQSVWWDRLTMFLMVAFTAAGFFAVSHSETFISAGDLIQVR